MNKFFLLSIVLCFSSLKAESIDDYLRNRLAFFDVVPYEDLPIKTNDDYRAKVELGKKLFIDSNLSGNRNISCHTCHNSQLGTSDALPLSRTEDMNGILRRNSISLFNVGDKTNHFMFWDGRVHYNPQTRVFTTPEFALNGDLPEAKEITTVLKSALSAQAIFPLVSHEEMRGQIGDNEIANAKTSLTAWDAIVKRVTTEEEGSQYLKLFNRAFPNDVTNKKAMNIGHIGESMATFMKEQFHSNGSPFHEYLKGNNQAMTEQQKRGLLVFIERGKCIACHQGNLLGNNSFFTSVGVPSYGAKPFRLDKGRGEVENDSAKNFFFKTPSLINVALSAPYMHNGSFKTLKEVIQHYNNVSRSLKNFTIDLERQKEFPVIVEVKNDPLDLQAIWSSIQAGFLRQGLGLTPSEAEDLEIFLKDGLTDPKWQINTF